MRGPRHRPANNPCCWFDVAEGEEEAGAELLRSAPWQVELEINLPGDWRERADLRTAAEARFTAATDRTNHPMAANFTKAGFPVVRERINFHPAGRTA